MLGSGRPFPYGQECLGPPQEIALSYRRQVKASGEAQQDETCLALAKKLWKMRRNLLKKPGNLSAEENKRWQPWKARIRRFASAFGTSPELGDVPLELYLHSEALAWKLPLQQLEVGSQTLWTTSISSRFPPILLRSLVASPSAPNA